MADPAPLPEYTAHIQSLSPGSPSCVLRSSEHQYEKTLAIAVPDLPDSPGIEVQIRKVAAKDLRTRTVDSRDVRIEPGMRIAISGIWSDLWQEYEATWATVRLLLDGAPLTRWSPSFIIADDAAACVQVWLPSTALSSSSPAPSTPTMAPTQPHPTAVASAPLATPVPTSTTVSPNSTTVSTPTPAKSLPPSPTIGLTASPPAAETQPTVTVPPPAQETSGNFLSGLSPIWLAIWVIVGLMIGVALVYYIWTVFRN